MLPTFESNADKNKLLFVMASLSPKVADSLDKESYRESADPDTVTEEYIFEDAFVDMMRDLETIGVKFKIDYSDYINDPDKLSLFIELASLLLPNSLYSFIKVDTTIRETIEHIVKGSLGNDETVIQTYLTEIGGLDNNIPLRPNLVDLVDNLYPLVDQTDVFSDYLINLLDLYHQERISPITDDERHRAYSEFIKDKVGRLSDAVSLFENTEQYRDLMDIQNHIIKDFLAPDNFVAYAYLFLEKKEDLPDDLQAGFDRKIYHYKVSHPWCEDYYKLRNIPIPEAYRIMLACFVYAFFAPTKQDYINNKPMYGNVLEDSKNDMIMSLYQE